MQLYSTGNAMLTGAIPTILLFAKDKDTETSTVGDWVANFSSPSEATWDFGGTYLYGNAKKTVKYYTINHKGGDSSDEAQLEAKAVFESIAPISLEEIKRNNKPVVRMPIANYFYNVFLFYKEGYGACKNKSIGISSLTDYESFIQSTSVLQSSLNVKISDTFSGGQFIPISGELKPQVRFGVCEFASTGQEKRGIVPIIVYKLGEAYTLKLCSRCYDWDDFERVFGKFSMKDFDDDKGPISGEDGGGGSFNTTSDGVGIPSLPSLGISSTGFVNVYVPSPGTLKWLGQDLFPDISERLFEETEESVNPLVTLSNNISLVGKTLHDLINSFINSKLIEYVIDCHIIPCKPIESEQAENIKIGFKEFYQRASKALSDYVQVDCGSIQVKEYYANFIDYVGTTAKLYLPFVGFVDVEPELFQNGILKVVYNFNVIDGSFIAFVMSSSSKSQLKDSVVASYSGACCVHIPLTGLNYSSMISGIVGGSASMLQFSVKGNISGAVDSAVNVMQSKPNLAQSNQYNSTSAFLSVRKPYLLISRQVSSYSKDYAKEKGLPLNVTKRLSEVKGMTICNDIITDSLNCTFEEKEMIKNLFKSGVIL